MTAPDNVLDFLADCAETCQEDFPGKIERRYFHGTHGRSQTKDLMITLDDGSTYRVTAELQPVPG